MNTHNNNAPIVHFPNATAKAHPLLLSLIVLAFRMRIVPERKYGFLADHMPSDFEPLYDNMADTYQAIGQLIANQKNSRSGPNFKLLGELFNVNLKHIVEDIADVLFFRAKNVCKRLEAMAKNDPGAIPDSLDLTYFTRDLVTLTAVVNSRAVWTREHILLEHLSYMENMQLILGQNEAIDALCRKLRVITRPRKNSNRAPQTNTAPAVVTDAPVAPVNEVVAASVVDDTQPAA